jgi:hypothetical protein
VADQAEKDALAEWAANQTCPGCGHPGMAVTWQLQPRPWGGYSLAGMQTKFAASEVPVLSCPGCGIASVGRRG